MASKREEKTTRIDMKFSKDLQKIRRERNDGPQESPSGRPVRGIPGPGFEESRERAGCPHHTRPEGTRLHQGQGMDARAGANDSSTRGHG